MKNLLPYNDDCVTFYDKLLKRKRDDGLKQRLAQIRVNIEEAYSLYNQAFNINRLQDLTADVSFLTFTPDLACLYSYSSKAIRDLKKQIDDIQDYPLSNVCQNCTINSVNSMDHVLGQAQFPEFCVHPCNLFPSCMECNNLKSASFARNGTRRFLNLYSDLLPSVQYLFLNIFINQNGDLDYKFVVENRNNIDIDLFALILNHYKELDLFKRMRSRSIKFYSELRNTITSRLEDVEWEVLIRQVKREAINNKNNLGVNHFEYVLQTEMIDNVLFRQSF